MRISRSQAGLVAFIQAPGQIEGAATRPGRALPADGGTGHETLYILTPYRRCAGLTRQVHVRGIATGYRNTIAFHFLRKYSVRTLQ